VGCALHAFWVMTDPGPVSDYERRCLEPDDQIRTEASSDREARAPRGHLDRVGALDSDDAAVITRDDIGKVRVTKDETSTRFPESEDCDEY